jgi:hypothetical protein
MKYCFSNMPSNMAQKWHPTIPQTAMIGVPWETAKSLQATQSLFHSPGVTGPSDAVTAKR